MSFWECHHRSTTSGKRQYQTACTNKPRLFTGHDNCAKFSHWYEYKDWSEFSQKGLSHSSEERGGGQAWASSTIQPTGRWVVVTGRSLMTAHRPLQFCFLTENPSKCPPSVQNKKNCTAAIFYVLRVNSRPRLVPLWIPLLAGRLWPRSSRWNWCPPWPPWRSLSVWWWGP